MYLDPYRHIPYYGHSFSVNPRSIYRQSEIEANKYQELLRRGFKGTSITPESTAPDGIGHYKHYRDPNGREWSIYWHPDTGAKEVHGPIRDKWVSLGREGFGYPITDEFVTNDGTGRFNYFKAVQEPGKLVKAIFWSLRTGAHPVSGPILTKWAEFGFESTLGFPIEDEKDRPGGGRIQRFQKGIITWTPQTGASVEEMTTS